MPSQWRLAVLLGFISISSLGLAVFFVRSAVSRDLRRAERAVVRDDLVQFATVYAQSGISGLREVFTASQNGEGSGMRITDAQGKALHEELISDVPAHIWPAAPPKSLMQAGDTSQQEILSDGHLLPLSLGVIRLKDGNTLWLVRSNLDAERYLANIQNHLWLAGIAAALIAMLPVLWYSYDVLHPIKAFTASAKRLHSPEGEVRLIAPRAIPELKTLASVINAGLDRILGLTRELQSTNDQLAHELRTPLARIRGNLESLHDKTDNHAAQEAAAHSLEEIDRAAQLVQTILTVRGGDHGALRLYRQATPVHQLIENLVELFTPAAEDRKLTLSIEQGLDLVLNIDRELISQAISNLLDNALAYTPRGGHVTLRWQAEGTGAIILVKDTGPGVHPEETEAIWERYYRGTASMTRHPGIGLGLSLVRAIATAHGGSTGVHNRESSGAIFWIKLPQG